MEAVPTIDRDALVAALERCFPNADVRWSWVNRSYRSWTINIASGPHRIEIAWGPLSGFGGTDQNNFREDANLFGAFDWPLDSAEAAVEFVAGVLATEVSHNPPMQCLLVRAPAVGRPLIGLTLVAAAATSV
jgi:hypothetical protein